MMRTPVVLVVSLVLGCSNAEPSEQASRAGSGEPSRASASNLPPAEPSSPSPMDPDRAVPAPAPSLPTTASPAVPSEAQAPGSIDIEPPAPSSPDTSAPDDSSPAPGSNAVAQTCNLPGTATATTPNIWVVGDSTASIYGSDLYPRMGWAQPLQDYYAPACAAVNDRALSGRSSKSFVDEGAWAPVRDALRAGDFVLIQFGHNDEKTEDPLRGTDPATTFRTYLSLFIDDTLAHGATPVLLTPIQRNNWDGTTLRETHGAYPDAIRQLAQARDVTLVDASALTREYLERIGPVAANDLFMNLAPGQFPNYPEGNADNTHLREAGAQAIARIILADLARQGSPVGRLVLRQQ